MQWRWGKQYLSVLLDQLWAWPVHSARLKKCRGIQKFYIKRNQTTCYSLELQYWECRLTELGWSRVTLLLSFFFLSYPLHGSWMMVIWLRPSECLWKIGWLIKTLLSRATFSFTFRWVLIIYLLTRVRLFSNLLCLSCSLSISPLLSFHNKSSRSRHLAVLEG